MRCSVLTFSASPVSCLLAGSMWLAVSATADVRLPGIFTDHMALQREADVPVWGWAEAGERVEVQFAGQTKSAKAGPDGRWSVRLDPMQASAEGRELVVATVSNAGRVEHKLSDVVVGEVWLASGQSNMEWSVRNSTNAGEEIAGADFGEIRLFHVPRANAPVPQDDVKAQWSRCSPETIANFSAVAYFFGRRLHRELNLPVGLVASSWGGTRIEPWTPPEGFASVPELQQLHETVMLASPASAVHKQRLQDFLERLTTWLQQTKQCLDTEALVPAQPSFPKELLPLNSHTSPGALYNAMIHPLVPYAIRGAIWYQGESNRHDGKLYYHKMRALINGWRQVWGRGEIPFYYVQLAPFIYTSDSAYVLPRLWEAQARALDIPNTGMAVINDIGNLRDIHPKNKQDVGKRLALLALARTYGNAGVVCSGPTCKGMAIDGSTIRISFANVGTGLASRDGKALSWFELIGKETDFIKANAVIDGDTVIVSSPEVRQPVAVRFAWHEEAQPNLMNKEGLPAAAFRVGEVPLRHNIAAKRVPEAKEYVPVFTLEIPDAANFSKTPVEYALDHRTDITEPFDRVAYYLELQRKGEEVRYVYVSMDAFTQDIGKVGVPTLPTQALFQQKVANMNVVSNVAGLPRGTGLTGGNIEFWPSNYGPGNNGNVPNASSAAWDFGDSGGQVAAGYGCMQVHDHEAKVTLFAYNRWGAGGNSDLGIGNQAQANPDWTFAQNAPSYLSKRLQVLVRVDR